MVCLGMVDSSKLRVSARCLKTPPTLTRVKPIDWYLVIDYCGASRALTVSITRPPGREIFIRD